MNGPHDMGGMQCYGPVKREVDEPVFHGEWEKRALALTVAVGGAGMWNLDQSRFARESLPPVKYLSSSYYQIWLAGLEKLMVENGMVSKQELVSGKAMIDPVQLKNPVFDRRLIKAALKRGGSVERKAERQALFMGGDKVVALETNPEGHTRLPRYVRGKPGKVVDVLGCHVFPDMNAKGEGENPQWLYSVEFSAQDLFGAGDHLVFVDCFEPYLRADK